MLKDTDPSSDRTENRRPFTVDEWRIHPDLNRLVRGEQTVSVEPRVMEVLVCLAEHPGEVLGRDTLLDRVWGDVVIQEEALTHAISRLRRAFGDSTREPRYIETIPKRGYRLIAVVGELAEVETATVDRSPSHPPLPRSRRGTRLWVSLALLAAVVAALVIPRLYLGDADGTRVHEVLEGTPLTSYPGEEHTPALSPDGTRVAFTWNGGEGENFDLFVKQLDAATPLRLTETPGPEYAPRWSPDGSELLYLRDDEGREVISVLPATGGEPRPVLSIPRPGGILGADWEPSGESLIVSTRAAAEEPWVLGRLTLESGELEPILTPPEGAFGDTWPRCSRAGEIAFQRNDGLGRSGLYHLAEVGSEPRRLIAVPLEIRGFDWTADEAGLIFSSATAFAGEFRLWLVELEGCERTWLPTRGLRSIYPTIAREAGNLVYVEETYRRSVVEAEADAPFGAEQGTSTFAPSSHSEYDAHYSPDGSRIAFISTRSGAPEIYVADRDGSGIRQLTSSGGSNPEFLQWSPDGEWIAFEMMSGTRLAVHVTDVERGVTRALTRSPDDEILLSWAVDTSALYLRVRREGEWSVKRVDLETGETESTYPFDAYMMAEAAGGETLYFIEAGTHELRRTTADPEISEVVLTEKASVMQCYWSVEPEGILLYRSKGAGIELSLFEFEGETIRPIYRIPRRTSGRLDLAPDRASLLYDHVEEIDKDLIRVESFSTAADD